MERDKAIRLQAAVEGARKARYEGGKEWSNLDAALDELDRFLFIQIQTPPTGYEWEGIE